MLRVRLSRAVRALTIALSSGCLAVVAQGQSAEWSTSLVIAPNPSPYLTDWERVPSTALLSVTYTGTSAVDFRVRVTLTSTQRGLIGSTESPAVTVPGGPTSFLYNSRDAVFEWTTVSRNSTVTESAIRTGQIPEGDYRACARVLVGSALTPVAESCSDFSILQPDPPQLLMPQNGGSVVSTQPMFQWTPVLAPPSVPLRYEILVVELLSASQQPRAALESNIPVLRTTSPTPFLVYPVDALPLERSKRYAWRIRAVDDAGRVLFRDGAASEIWSFEMSDELLRPVGTVADLPDEVVLMPGVARLRGLRAARLTRTDTDVTVNGEVTLEFLGAGMGAAQRVEARDLRLGFRGAELSALDGRLTATLPTTYLRADLRAMIRFGPLEYTPATGFQATATLSLPGNAPVPLAGQVQLTANGLTGRLESGGSGAATLASVGRAPVQYAATAVRLFMPEGRLEFTGDVRLFEQAVGCPATGTLEEGVIRMPVYCEPNRGYRPDTSVAGSMLSFGTLAGSLAADFLTDTLGSDLRTTATFSVFGSTRSACVMRFTMILRREAVDREQEQVDCADGAAADYGWLRLLVSNLRIERLGYTPGGMLGWRALVDLNPELRGAPSMQLAMLRDVVLDEQGVHLPTTNSAAPGSSTPGYGELDGYGVLLRTIGVKGGLRRYRDWLRDDDPGLEWGSRDSWIRLPLITPQVSNCLNAMPYAVDTLIIGAGRITAALRDTVIDGGCKVFTAPTLAVLIKEVGGRVVLALDSVPRATEHPTVVAEATDHRGDCGVPILGCVGGAPTEPLQGDFRLLPTGRLRGTATNFKASWVTLNLRVAKLTPTNGRFTLGVDAAGAQTAVYDGEVKVDFTKVEQKAESADTGAAATAAGGASSAAGLLGARDEGARAQAQLNWIRQRFIGGRITIRGPLKMEVGFVKFILTETTLDTLGFHVDGRHRVLVQHTTEQEAPASTSGTTPPRAPSYTTRTDTTGVTFAGVRVDPEAGDIVAGTVTFDGRLALESSPFSAALELGGAALGGAVDSGGTGALNRLGSAASGTNVFGFELVDASGAFDKSRGMIGNIRLQLPSSPTMDAQGMRISGIAPARAAFASATFDSASVSFENGFAMRPAQGRVTAGRAVVRVRDYPIAYLESGGWRLALAELAQTIIPDTLFLRDRWTAFVVLRDSARGLLVEVTDTAGGKRIRTRPGTAVRVVMPALRGSRPRAPSAAVAMDLVLEQGSWRPIAGSVTASTDFADLDGPAPNFPFSLDSVRFRASESAAPSFGAFGRLAVFPGAREPMRVGLEFLGGGELRAAVEQPFTDSIPLVPGSSLVRFGIDTLRFTAQGKLAEVFHWAIELPGSITYQEAGRPTERLARGTFRITENDASLQDFESPDSLMTVPLPGVDLRLGHVRVPTLRWDFATQRFDFELLFDVGLRIPALDSLALPEIRDIRLTPQGISIPSFEMASMPSLPDAGDPFARDRNRELRIGGFAVRALAYRVSEFRWNWFSGAPPPTFDFGVDLEFSVNDVPTPLEGYSSRLALRALDVGFQNGRFNARFEPLEIPRPIRTPVADIRGAFGSFSVAQGQPSDVRIGVIADLRLPDVLACPDEAARMLPLSSATDTIFVASNGTLRGSVRNVIPRCPMALGPFNLAFGQSQVRFDYDATRQRVDVALDMAATLSVTGDAPGETVSATGRVVLDIDEGRLLDASLAIPEPFFWAPDPANPFLRLVVDTAALTRDELRFGATGELRTPEGAGVDVAFENVRFDLNTMRLRDGRIRLTADAAVGFEIGDAGEMLFGVYPVTSPRGSTASARLVLPQGALLDTAGFHVSGTATGSLAFGGNEYAALAAEFANDFTIRTNGQVAIRRGRINLRDTRGEMIAYADSSGFWPGNVFAVLPIPARLGVPSEDVAYLELRDPADTSRLLVATEFSGQTLRLHTRDTSRVRLVMPGLARNGPIPEIRAAFDLVLNARTLAPISGGFLLEAPDGQSLVPLEGLPIALTRLGFAADSSGWKLKAGALAKLPGPLGDVDLAFHDIEVARDGLTGVIELGQYSEVHLPNAPSIAEADLLGDTLTIAFTGARLRIGADGNDLKLSGGIRSALLGTVNGAPRVFHLAATIDQNGFRGAADLSDREVPLAIGEAELTLENGPDTPALLVRADAQQFTLVMGGTLRLPEIAPGFSLGVRDFAVGSGGVSIPNVSVTGPQETAEFELFGARFALRDSTVGSTQVAPAIGIGYNRGVVRFTLSGYVTLLENTTRFIGLQFGTDGSFGLQGADFISRPIVLIDSVAALTRVAIVDSRLELRGEVTLPEPFAQAPQELFVRIAPDGTVSGGGKVVILNESAGLGADKTVLEAGIAAFHLRYLALEIDLESAANSGISTVADIYIQEDPDQLIQFGRITGGTVTPGLRVGFDGDVTFGGLFMPRPVTVKMDPVSLTFTEVTSETDPDGGFSVSISGGLSLMLEGSGGSLNFRDVGFNSKGEIKLGAARIDGGTFVIQDVVKIVVGNLAWGTSDTTIWVPVAAPPGANGELTFDSTFTQVSSFLDLGATIDIADVFAGGVKRLMFYVRSDDRTTHFLLQELNVEIEGVIDFTATMTFDEYTDGFDLSLIAEGEILSAYRIGMVGVIGQRANVFRAGLFLRTSVTVTIIPGIVTLTEVGGGLFINPTARDLALVKAIAGMNGPSSDRVGMPPAGAFAVMLYAAFEFGGSNGASVAAGRALVTITDQAFQINAQATFFQMDRQLSGDLALQVGWTPSVYVRGDVSLLLEIPKTVRGEASVQFFAGNNLFAIKGEVDLRIIEVIEAGAEVIIVPSGFTANLTTRMGVSTDVVTLGFAANLRIWYRPSTNDLGAYMRMTGSVAAFGVTGQIVLVGALVIQPELAIYAQGSAQIVGVDALKFDVWVQYANGNVTAGIGHNEELAAALARAEQVAAELEAEADRILAGISDAELARARIPIAVPDSSLAAAYRNFQRWNVWELWTLWGGFRATEADLAGGLLALSATDAYVSFYERVLTNREAAADTAIVRQLREEADRRLQVIAGRRAEVEQQIQALRFELDAAEAAAAFVPPADPVLRWDAGSPTLVAGADGRMMLANAPQFELDDALAGAARSTMTDAAESTRGQAERMRAQLQAVEAGLATVIAATSASAPGSFSSYARLHSELVDAIEHQHAANVDFRMRRTAWIAGKLDTLATRRAGLVQRVNDRVAGIRTQVEAMNLSAVQKRWAVLFRMDTLAYQRARYLAAFALDPSILQTYETQSATRRTQAKAAYDALRSDASNGPASGTLETHTTWFTEQAVNYGVLIWWGVANAGLSQAQVGARALVTSADSVARPVIRDMRDMHARFTSQLASLNTRQAELYGVLYDLYDNYLRTFGTEDAMATAYRTRRSELGELLQAPRVTGPRVTVTDYGYLSSVQSTWSGTHPRGVYEYLIQENDDSLFTIGSQGSVRRWQYTTEPAGGSVAQNERLMVRGGAGFTAMQLTPFTVTFARGSAGTPVTNVATPPADFTAPSPPSVSFTAARLITAIHGDEWWTGDSTQVAVRWSASDPESGIAEYEYRVVTLPLPTGTGPAQLGVGALGGPVTQQQLAAMTPVEILPWTSAGGRSSAIISGLRLPATRGVFVEVRARNGAGILGSSGSSGRLRLDVSRPAFASGTTLTPALVAYTPFVSMGTYTVPGYTVPLLSTCGSVATLGRVSMKVWDGRLVTVNGDTNVVGGGASYTLRYNRPTATDGETGIAAYQFRVDTVAPSGAVPLDGWTDLPGTDATFVATSPLLVYGRPRWVSLAARNGAGSISAPLTHGPQTVNDGTGPNAPVFCADYSSGGFIAYMATPSADAETGVRGYQMRVRGPTGAIVRDFPSGRSVDWPATQAAAGMGVRVPVGLASGGAHTVDLRAVNGAGVVGDIASSGTLMVDVSPPPVAGVSGTASIAGVRLNLTIATDPESGLSGVEIAFGTGVVDLWSLRAPPPQLLVPYTTYAARAGTSTLSIPLPESVSRTPGLTVYVRVRNGVGLLSAVSTAVVGR